MSKQPEASELKTKNQSMPNGIAPRSALTLISTLLSWMISAWHVTWASSSRLCFSQIEVIRKGSGHLVLPFPDADAPVKLSFPRANPIPASHDICAVLLGLIDEDPKNEPHEEVVKDSTKDDGQYPEDIAHRQMIQQQCTCQSDKAGGRYGLHNLEWCHFLSLFFRFLSVKSHYSLRKSYHSLRPKLSACDCSLSEKFLK